jgi:hypothetical protein
LPWRLRRAHSVSYAANDINNPWRTIDNGIVSLQPGDTLYIRGGNYTATSTIEIDSRTGVGASGTQTNPIHVTSYPGEQVVIDLSSVSTWLYIVGLHYWEISNLEFINALYVVNVGGTARLTQNTAMRNNVVTMNRGGDNSAAFWVGNASDTVIDGNVVVGPGNGVNQNTGCVFMDRDSAIKVLNNRLSNCPNGIHYKHANSNVPGADIEIAYNHITNCGRSGMHYNGNYGYIHDNIFGPGAPFTLPLPNGSPGGHNNIIEHNTFVGAGINFQQASGDLINNVLRNNLFTSEVIISRYTVIPHSTVLDFNMHDPGNAVNEFGTTYSLQQWRSYYGGSANSIEGSPTFVSGQNPILTSDYRLASGSAGAGAASDGTDMGVRLDLFGSTGTLLVRPEPPQSLTAN